MHLEDGVLQFALRGLVVDGIDDAHPQSLRQSDLAHARSDHAADALIVARLIEQEQQIGFDRDLVERAGVVAEFAGERPPDLGAVALDEVVDRVRGGFDSGGGAGRGRARSRSPGLRRAS